MQRPLAAAAILLGTVGVVPLLLEMLPKFGVLPPEFVYDAAYWPGGFASETVQALFSLLVAPTLLLWGLVAVPRTTRTRGRVLVGALIVCLCTAPFGYGLILCIPLFLCWVLPLMRRFKADSGGLPPGPV